MTTDDPTRSALVEARLAAVGRLEAEVRQLRTARGRARLVGAELAAALAPLERVVAGHLSAVEALLGAGRLPGGQPGNANRAGPREPEDEEDDVLVEVPDFPDEPPPAPVSAEQPELRPAPAPEPAVAPPVAPVGTVAAPPRPELPAFLTEAEPEQPRRGSLHDAAYSLDDDDDEDEDWFPIPPLDRFA